MDLQLKGKTAFISGSTQGIGFAIAKQLLQEGAAVIINGRNPQKVNDAIDKLKAIVPGGDVKGLAADFSKANQVNDLLHEIQDVDILINNAGIFEPVAFTEISDEKWFEMFEVNVMSGVRLSRQVFPRMLSRNWGRIIFISSESAVQIPEEMIHYGMSKTAQLSIARGLAELTKGTGVTVNSVLPGPTESEGVKEFVKQLAASQNKTVAEAEKDFFNTARPSSLLRRFETVDEVASMVTYISSPLASATNGAALRVDGGVTRSIV